MPAKDEGWGWARARWSVSWEEPSCSWASGSRTTGDWALHSPPGVSRDRLQRRGLSLLLSYREVSLWWAGQCREQEQCADAGA